VNVADRIAALRASLPHQQNQEHGDADQVNPDDLFAHEYAYGDDEDGISDDQGDVAGTDGH
jgi:hypothetical protein